jgi:hypothetical protein
MYREDLVGIGKRGGRRYQYISASGFMTGVRAAMGGWSLLAVMVGIGQDAGTLYEAVHLRSQSSDACPAGECVSSAALHHCHHKQANHIQTPNKSLHRLEKLYPTCG